MAEGPRAEDLYVEAIDRLGRTRIAVDLARAHLLYGEWLRRQRRRRDARKELRVAHGLFDFGMEAFAERPGRAAGQASTPANGPADTLDQLTPQGGADRAPRRGAYTNRDIAAQLFISPSTVEYHLRKAFRNST